MITDMYTKDTTKGVQFVAEFIEWRAPDDASKRYLWMPTFLTKNFKPDMVEKWGNMLRAGSRAYFRYDGKKNNLWSRF